MSRALIGLFIGALIMSNIGLWVNFYILKCAHFDFEKSVLDLLKIFAEKPTDNGSDESADETTNEI